MAEKGIIREDGTRYAKLVHVSVGNGKTHQSNKVYIMEEQSNGQIKCVYGRVGGNMATKMYPSSKWNSIYNNKTSSMKGYVDMTEHSVVKEAAKSGLKDIAEAEVQKLFDDLMDYANKSIGANYKITQDKVTQKQVDLAQSIIDEMANIAKSARKKKAVKVDEINERLITLYTTIPRKMKDVRDHLLNEDDFTTEEIKEFIANEQSILDTMAGQVLAIAQADDDEDEQEDGEDQTILEKMGLDVSVETDQKSRDLVTKLLGKNAGQMVEIYKCINKETQKKFDEHYAKAKNKKRLLLWHGSRNQNWFNIIQTGLMIRPSGVVHTGSMFGDGIYFANKAQKSLGYSSLSGSYWARGNDSKGYLALFDVHLGNQKDIHKHDSSCYNLSQKVLDKGGHDCVFAHSGADLYNDEIIVYTPEKCTIAYIIEMTN